MPNEDPALHADWWKAERTGNAARAFKSSPGLTVFRPKSSGSGEWQNIGAVCPKCSYYTRDCSTVTLHVLGKKNQACFAVAKQVAAQYADEHKKSVKMRKAYDDRKQRVVTILRGTEVQFRDEPKRNSKRESSNVPAASGSQDAARESPDIEMVDLTGQEDIQQSAEPITPGLATPVRNEGIALGMEETRGNKSAQVPDEEPKQHKENSCIVEMKQENARLKEKLDTLQQEHAKLSTAAKDSKAALQEKVERLQSDKKSLLVERASLKRQADRVSNMEQDQAGWMIFKDEFKNLVQKEVKEIDTHTKHLSVGHFVEKAAGLKDACDRGIHFRNLQEAESALRSSLPHALHQGRETPTTLRQNIVYEYAHKRIKKQCRH